MPSLFDIAKSGVQSYRQALAVTGQNIANINTDGYKRREAGLTEVSSGQGGITQIQDGTGLGVRVEDIKRSFDAYLLDRKRNSFSREETATNFLEKISELEDLLLPGDADLGSSMGLFFSSLQEVAASPADVAARVVAVEEGKNVAATFSRTSEVLGQLKTGAKSHAQQEIDTVNILTKEILNVNSKLLSSSTQGGAANALLDNRDRLIDELSKTLEVTCTYTAKNAAIVRLGGSGSGPKIVEDSKRITLGLDEESTDIKVILGPGTLNSPTNQVTNGALRGLIDASKTVEQTIKDLDSLAQKFAQEINDQHKNGLTLDGLKGKDMFTSVGFTSTQNPTNMGNTTASAVASGGGLINPDPVKLVYSAPRNEWVAYDLQNNELASDLTSISTQGVTITLLGSASDGDEITINPSNNFSKDMEFALRRAEDIAASASFLISADTKNLSDASISADSTGTIQDTTLAKVSNVFTNSLSPISATTLFNDGFVASIPKATEAIELASFSKQSALQFTLSTSDLTAANQLSFSVGGTAYSFDLAYGDVFKKLTGSPASETSATGAWEDASEIAKYLNLGELNAGGTPPTTLQSLGIFASGNAGNLTLSLTSGDFATGATITAGASTINAIKQSSDTASNIQIFTREGRHIAGSPLTKLEKSTFMSTANGFSEQAVYDADYLNLQEPTGYRGLSLERVQPTGTFSIPLGGDGVGRKAKLGLGSLPASATSTAYELNLYFPDLAGDSLNTTIAAGSSAKFAANQINENMSDLGIRASARNRIELYSLSGNGEISFDIESRNQKPITITTSTTASDLTALYESLNQQSGQVGIDVFLSKDKTRIVLESVDGEDISLSSYSSASELTLKTRFVDKNSKPIGDNTATMHGRGDTDPITLGSFLVQNNAGSVAPIDVSAGQMALDGTISAGTGHGLRVGDTIILNDLDNANETTTGLTEASLSSGNSGTRNGGPLYYVKSVDIETGAFKLASGSAIGSDVTLTAGGAETGNSHALRFYQVKLIDAGRFGGVLNLEAASSFQSVVTGGATNTATADPLVDGLVKQTTTSTGEKQTLNFKINEQIDFNAGDTLGQAASAAAATYGVDVNFVDASLTSAGTAFSASVTSSSLKEQTTSALTKAIANSLRSTAPISSIKGETVATIPEDGSSLTVSFNGQNYLLTMVKGEVVVTGGELERVSAYFESVTGGYSLKVAAPDGVLTGAQFSVPTTVSGNSDAATIFGMSPANVTKTIIGRSVNSTGATITFPVEVNGVSQNVSITTTAGNTNNSVANTQMIWVDDGAGKGHLQITISGDSTTLAFENNNNAETIGLKTADILVYVKDEDLELETTDGQVLDVTGSASTPMSSLSAEKFKLTNLPPEELIVIVNGGGARKIAASFDSNPPTLEEITPELTIKVTNDAGNVIEILDKETGHSIATRQLDNAGAAGALGFLFKIDGKAVEGDIFNFSANSGGVGDNRNISAVLELQREKNGKGGFQQIFSNIVSKVGSQVKSGKLNVEAAEAMREASEEAEAQFSGVNLDSQAAALIEFQQAYQASSRILQTARELFQTLIDTV